MIVSKQILSILENYVTSIKHHWTNVPYPVYVNPTSSDYNELKKNVKELNNPQYKKLYSIRFVADLINQKVYVADGYLSLHRELFANLSINKNNCIQGEAAIKGAKPVIWYVYGGYPEFVYDNIGHSWESDFSKRVLDSKYMKWLELYFDLSRLKKYGLYGKEDGF